MTDLDAGIAALMAEIKRLKAQLRQEQGKPAPGPRGRPRKYAKGTARFYVRLTPAQVDAARKLGDGNINAGVQKSIEYTVCYRVQPWNEAAKNGAIDVL